MSTLKILHLEDDALDSEMVKEDLCNAGLSVEIHRVDTVPAFAQALDRDYSLIFSDFSLPGVDPMEALHVAREKRPDIPFIFLSGTLGEDIAIETLKLGATDYVLKQRMGRLVPAVRRALQEAEEHARRRTAEQQAQLFKFFSENANDGHVLYNDKTRILYVNKLACERLGYTHEELLRLKMTDINPELSSEKIDQLFRQRNGRRLAPFEATHKRKDGSTFPVEITCAVVEIEGERLIFATSRDITERKRHETALACAYEKLEEQVKERTASLQNALHDLEHFSHTVSHDLRAPLRAMKAFAEILQEDAAATLSPEHRDYLERIKSSAERMDNLIYDTLIYSRTSRENFILRPVDVDKLLHSIIDSYTTFQPARVHIEIEGRLPAVLATEAGLTQCFSNLLNNAIKFVREGETPFVRIRAERSADAVRLWFEDNGIGIAKEHHHKIFGMFERLSTQREGTGVGLALVRKAVERMCGKVGVESDPGQGSRFWLEFKSCESCAPELEIPAKEVCGHTFAAKGPTR